MQRTAAATAQLLIFLLLALVAATATAFLLPAPGSFAAHRAHVCSSSSSSRRSSSRAVGTIRASVVEETAAAAAGAGAEVPSGRPVGGASRPPAPKPDGPWILLEGLSYAAVEADLQAFLEGFEVKAVQMPLAPANTKRAGETKGIGIVELGSEAEAARAVESLNGKEILGRWVTVEQCVDPTATKTIKIRGVPFAATPEDLGDYFGGLFGEVEHVVVSHDRNGIAYVTFKENSSAVAALGQDGCEMDGRWLDITLYLKGAFRPPQERPPRPQSQQREGGQQRQQNGGGGGSGTYSRRNRLRLSGLPFEATREEVAEAMGGLGLEVSNVFLPPFKGNPGRNIGLAYLNAADEAMFQKALEIGNFVLGERTVYINEAQERVSLSGPGAGVSSRPPRRDQGGGDFGGQDGGRRQGGGGGMRDAPWAHRVYMGNLPFDMEAEDIAAFFREKGVVPPSKIALPKTKVGTAYVAFDSQESAEAAAALDGTLIEKAGRTRYLRANLMDSSS